jgi:hypothetical protein
VRVWRVAHDKISENGFPTGPYSQREELPEIDQDALSAMSWAHGDERHPTPFDDDALFSMHDYERCGFDSLAALYGWFSGQWHGMLRAAGYLIYVYDVPDDDARVGDLYGQTLFNPARATLVDLREIGD